MSENAANADASRSAGSSSSVASSSVGDASTDARVERAMQETQDEVAVPAEDAVPADEEIVVGLGHPGFATTAFGAGDVRDTPRIPSAHEASPEVDPWIGRVLSNVYRVEGKIGEGGMGTVYAARHVHLGKQYAVKVLSASVATNATAVERLKQEAIAASSIDHDNIVEVISFDRYADGAVFIVMEYLRGESLADRVSRGPLPLHEALSIAHQICGALGTAHQRDIVHRDLKPENVFLARRGELERVKVLDFGISKVKTADAEQVRMTRTGQLVGTPLYMSPEQARGESEIDRRVDVYALGVILYEMVTGSPPFEGRNYFELLWKHGNEAPQPPTKRNPNVHLPDEVEAVLLRALAKRREDRFSTMEELADGLAKAAPDVVLPATSPSLPPRSSPELRAPRATPSGPVARVTSTATSSSVDAPMPLTTRKPQPSSDALPPLPTQRVPTWAMVAGGAALVVVLALVVRGMGEAEAPARPEAPSHDESARHEAQRDQPATAPTPSEALPVAPDPAQVEHVAEIALDSTPSGAEVRAGDRVLGTTPTFVDLPIGAPVTLRFHRDGFLDEAEELMPAPGARVSVRLRRRARGAASSDESGTSLPMKTEL